MVEYCPSLGNQTKPNEKANKNRRIKLNDLIGIWGVGERFTRGAGPWQFIMNILNLNGCL